MKKRNKIMKIAALVIPIVLVIASAVTGLVNNLSNNREKRVINENMPILPLSSEDPTVWEDEFNDETKIDPDPPGEGRSENYLVENGAASMINTCPAWTDPAWTRMRPITLINNAGQPFTNYILLITIEYDQDMQPDYDDIRFKHENNPGTWLQYWIEYKSASSANVWVKIFSVPTGESLLYLFYGNPYATDQSNFDGVFPDWDKKWTSDKKITNHANNEGAWDPDVAFGSNRFLVAWEEGTYPFPPYTYFFKQEIRGSIFDTDGNTMVDDFEIYSAGGIEYRDENPSIAHGGGKFFVAWEHYNTPTTPSTKDIMGRLVTTTGGLGSLISICTQSNIQADPNVAFDSSNNRFCVVWEDARSGTSNYNIYGRLYNTNGNPVGGEKTIVSAVNSQTEPWVAFDHVNNHYLIVWEDGETANNGPFDIWVGLFDSDLNLIGPNPGPSPLKLADGGPSIDYNFPCVNFCEETERFLVTWNNGDISAGDWWGNVWGTILDETGNVEIETFQIGSGEFIRTDIVPYLDSSFLVSYDDNDKIWGRLVTSNGEVLSDWLQLSVSSSADADWANMAIGNGKIFVSWEDMRVSYPFPWDNNPDAYGNMWNLDVPEGSEVNYIIGDELELVLSAYITSIAIEPTNLTLWNEFNAIFTGQITFDILDGETGVGLLYDVTPGQSIQGIVSPSIRLMASFSRTNPSYTPTLDEWIVNWISNHAPNTPTNPSPENGAMDVDIDADLSWTGGDPDPNDTVTYDVYFGTSSTPPQVAWNQSETTYDPGVLAYETKYYWKIVAWDSYGASAGGSLWNFTTEEEPNQPPYEPHDPDPPNHAVDVDINADLSWTGGDPNPEDIVTYDIYFGTSSSPPKVASNQSETTYDPGTMDYLTKYYWQIVAWDDHGAHTEGQLWDFTTEFHPNHPPYEPSDPDPEDGATDVSIDADLSWTGGDPDPGDTVTYDIYFGTITPPPLLVYDYPETSYDPGIMEYETKYYWQIVSWDDRGASTPGPIWNFTTEEEINYPPYEPSDPDPQHHATDVDVNADLSWSGGDPNPGDTVTYDIYFGTESLPPKIVSNQSETTYDPGTMSYNTTHYWKIIAWDNHGESTGGSVWIFTTEEVMNNPPEKPTITGPEDGIVGTEYEFTFVTTDPESENISYFVEWGDGNNTGWIGPYPSDEIANATYAWSESGIFEVKVKAKDEHQAEGPWSDSLYINISEFELQLALIFGLITNVSTEGEYIRFNADTVIYIGLAPMQLNILRLGETVIASQQYIGGIIKAETSLIIGLFEATILDNSTTTNTHSVIRNRVLPDSDLRMDHTILKSHKLG